MHSGIWEGKKGREEGRKSSSVDKLFSGVNTVIKVSTIRNFLFGVLIRYSFQLEVWNACEHTHVHAYSDICYQYNQSLFKLLSEPL